MNWLTTFILLSLFAMALIVVVFLIIEYGKKVAREAAEYDKIYDKIQRIMSYEVCEQNYDWIMRKFEELRNCKYKKTEKTEVLCNEFRIKFESIIEKRKNEVI